ncbi:unnamed protein product [Gulo gulo]|uniref:Homeobox domain-containing protein n=1 Tax=Gulo gulo TaxID=48420 RepID=A0A9X9LHS6_GULGU|nr:unnamed protein product [Gulo gulo]
MGLKKIMHPCKYDLQRHPDGDPLSSFLLHRSAYSGHLDFFTSPRVKLLPTSVEESTVKKEDTVQSKKQKTRTIFSRTQLYVLSDRSQRQKYLSFQQMRELSNFLNFCYKQVKTWFQNQRMKCKRQQENNWPMNSNSVTQNSSATIEYLGFYAYSQGFLMNAFGNLPTWSSQTWYNPHWSN